MNAYVYFIKIRDRYIIHRTLRESMLKDLGLLITMHQIMMTMHYCRVVLDRVQHHGGLKIEVNSNRGIHNMSNYEHAKRNSTKQFRV